MRPTTTRSAILALLPLAIALPAQAATYTVGFEANCTHETIQAAVNAANASPGADYIQLARSLVYEPIAVTIDTAQELTIEGGAASCYAPQDNQRTIISGMGGVRAPVFRIIGQTGSIIRIRKLSIELGDVAALDGKGGGIYYTGNGILDIAESSFLYNEAGYGGGLFAEGTGNAAEVIIGANTLFDYNAAFRNGGGIHIDNLEFTMNAPGTILAHNEARGHLVGGQMQYGYGGGMAILGDTLGTYATIGSNGFNGFGVITQNRARYGGGIAAQSANIASPVTVDLAGFAPGERVRLQSNVATQNGGAVFVRGTDARGVRMMARKFRMDDNRALNGSAIFAEDYAGIVLDACGPGIECGLVDHNQNIDAAGQPTSGSTIHVADAEGFSPYFRGFKADRVTMVANRGGTVLEIGTGIFADISNSLMANNEVSGSVVRNGNNTSGLNPRLLIENSTIAGNQVGGTHVISSDKALSLYRMILWQPGKLSLDHTGVLNVEDMIVSEAASIGATSSQRVYVTEPRFWDAGALDYRLHPSSPAVDFSSNGGGSDLLGFTRGLDLPRANNFLGAGDLGALELQGMPALIRNSGFEYNFNNWYVVHGLWKPENNGSAEVLKSSTPLNERVYAMSQCMHVPSAGNYRLRGQGRAGTGTPGAVGDRVMLQWHYRRDGGVGCADGAITQQGDVVITNTNQWTNAPATYINVPAWQWNRNTSIGVVLVVENSGTSDPAVAHGLFDNITLEPYDGVVPADDRIFASGFEAVP